MKNLCTRSLGSQQEGFILLLSVLITSVILAISFSIYSISLKELVLASFLKNSERAFIAADRGSECALYWDRTPTPTNPQGGITYTIFATSTVYQAPANLNNAVCDGRQLSISSWVVSGLTATQGRTAFSITFADLTCVDVTVFKDADVTTVTSNGYNTCNAGSSRRTQRTIQVRSNL